jgi:hypothetical protein
LSNYNKSYEFEDFDELNDLINNHSQNYFYTINKTIVYDKFWNDLFIDNNNKCVNLTQKQNLNGIKSYFIYFPQFHDIYENNINFYDGFNDIKNLNLLNNINVEKQEIPLKEYFFACIDFMKSCLFFCFINGKNPYNR